MGIKITDLPNINLPYNGSEEFPIVQGGVTKAAPLSTISNFLSAVLLADSELAVLSGVWQASYTSLTATSGNWNRGYTAFTFLTATSGAYQAAHTKMTTSSAAYDATQTKMTTSSAAYDATQTRVTTSSAAWAAAHTKMTTSSAAYDATQSGFTTNSGTYATRQHVHNGFFPLTGNATVTGPARFNSDVTVLGSLSVAGSASFVNTLFSTSSALSVVGNLNTGPVLYVGANGSGDIASFYDTDTGKEILHIGGDNGTFPNVGVKTSTPNVDFTVSGDISARSIIYDRAGDSVEWNTAYTVANASSASWIAATTKITASSGAYDATVTKVTASSGAYDATQTKMTTSSAAYDNVQTKFTTSSAAYDNAQTIISTTSATWNQLNTNMAGSSALWTDTYTKFSQSSASGASGTTKITASSGAYDATVTKMTASSGAYDATVTKFTTSSAAYDNTQSVFSTNSALYILSGGNTVSSILTIGTKNDKPLELETNNVSAMTILSTGNIVMATSGVATSPLLSASTSKLAVSGDVAVYGAISAVRGQFTNLEPGTPGNNLAWAVDLSSRAPTANCGVRLRASNKQILLYTTASDVNYLAASGPVVLRIVSESGFQFIDGPTTVCNLNANGMYFGAATSGYGNSQSFAPFAFSIAGSISASREIFAGRSIVIGQTAFNPGVGLTVNGNISSNSTFTGTNLVYNTGDQTIAGSKTFSGQLEATGQAATADTSIMTRGLTDTRFGTPYFLSLTDGVSANSTLFTSGVQTITLPAGVYQYESMVLASTDSTTAGANYVLSASRDDTRITSTTERIISNTKNIQGTSTTLPLYGSQLFNTALSGSFDSTRRQGSLMSHGVVVFGTSTTITPRIAQLTTTDASNAAVLEAGSYISFFKRG
jgi:hypothetical protein